MATNRSTSNARLSPSSTNRPRTHAPRCASAHALTVCGCLLWAALWSLLAVAQAELPEASERGRVSIDDPNTERGSERSRAAFLHQLQLRVEHAVQQRLPEVYAFEITDASNLRLRPDDAQLEVWGLLRREGHAPVMLQMLGRIDRAQQGFHIDGVRAYSEQREQTRQGLSLSLALTDLAAEDSWQAAR